MNKYYKILELDKIIEKLRKEIFLDSNFNKLDNIVLYDDIDVINEALNQVDEASKLIFRMGRFPLYFVEDVTEIFDKVKKYGVVLVEELLLVRKFIDTIRDIEIYINSLDNALISHPNIDTIIEDLYYPKKLNLRIKEIIDYTGEILDSASPNLKNIRRQIKETEKNIQNKLQEIISKNSSKLTQSIVSIRDDRYVIPVKNDFKGSIKGIVHGESSSGETVLLEATTYE